MILTSLNRLLTGFILTIFKFSISLINFRADEKEANLPIWRLAVFCGTIFDRQPFCFMLNQFYRIDRFS